MVLGHMGRQRTHHLVTSPPPPLEHLEGTFENMSDALGFLDRLMQLVVLMLMGNAFKCDVCRASFKHDNGNVNRSNHDRHQRGEYMPGDKQKPSGDVFVSWQPLVARVSQLQCGDPGSQVAVTYECA